MKFEKLSRLFLSAFAVVVIAGASSDAAAGKKRREASEQNEAEAKAYCSAQSGVDCKVVRANLLGCGGKNWEKAKEFGGKGKNYLACTRAVFEVNVQFVMGMPKADADENWVRDEIAIAERLFDSNPALKIKPTFVYERERGGRDLNALKFDKDKDFHKFMDDNFDTVAMSKTTGFLQVLVQTTRNGQASFPHNVSPFTRKHSPIVQQGATSTLAHELGHTFGLLHTFEAYTGGSTCNKDYKKGESGKGTTVKSDGSINVMDYRRGSRTVYLNSCQEERAAKKRKQWMTNKGAVNYKDIRGSR